MSLQLAVLAQGLKHKQPTIEATAPDGMSRMEGGEVGKLCYFAQPIENIRTQHVIAYELLLREWHEEQQRWFVPASFDIDAQTMIALLSDALAKLTIRRVSINLTNAQFADVKVMRALTEYVETHMQPRQLTVELVDSPDLVTLRRVGVGYRAAGILIAIDDVGSDNKFREIRGLLPYVNTIKFALQNMRKPGAPAPEDAKESLRFWFERAEEQQMLFTFEGIEDGDDIQLATQFGITRGQGYYFSKPQEPVMFSCAE
jgi:EAL domain-containing protein (putative c-di-GMP-specific phosphodiesterase class I)